MVIFINFFEIAVYIIENKVAVVEHRIISHSAPSRITPSLQHAHSSAFLDNAPQLQSYGAEASIYRWELEMDSIKLFMEVELLKSQL
jgi:hypothetical protein